MNLRTLIRDESESVDLGEGEVGLEARRAGDAFGLRGEGLDREEAEGGREDRKDLYSVRRF